MAPFFSLLRNRQAIDVALQVTGTLIVFLIATLASTQAMKFVGPKRLTFVALMLQTTACFILAQQSDGKDPP